ncbi:MAG: UDP-N-acetylmuramate dehydrogenase, partial [Candidatus Omnitrophica bacterium]|nr:UDP-N-acetylmuramate dehydrogenase [Candidatus Omnitrophota bacterium]
WRKRMDMIEQKKHKGIERKLKRNFSLKGMNTFQIEGQTACFLEAKNTDVLCSAIKWAQEKKFPWFTIGKGSNVLITDEKFMGVVIRLKGTFDRITVKEKEKIVKVGGGCLLSKVGHSLINLGWEGFEFMTVIPGTVGGAITMNAGMPGTGEIKDVLKTVRIIKDDCSCKILSNKELHLGYRSSQLQSKKCVIIEATFNLKKRNNKKALEKKAQSLAYNRKEKFPLGFKSAGSIFKNPQNGTSAAWYIENAGLKGFRIGEAHVALQHANWIVNTGRARACDIRDIIKHIQNVVYEKYKVKLEREIVYIPEDMQA